MSGGGAFTVDGRRPDYLIVGGGTSGCVLAARLSEDPRATVLLVEAGPDLREETMPEAIRSSYPSRAFFTREYFFPDLMARFGDVASCAGAPRPLARYEQAKVLGGGSTINGLLANRGAPADYDGWAALGAEGWSWDAVLPYFRRLERDSDHSGDLHGRDGPVPIRHAKRGEFSGFVRATYDVLRRQGLAEVEDQNGVWRGDAIMPVTTTTSEKMERASAAICYLTPQVRARSNLRIETGRAVLRLLVSGRAVIGAEVAGEGGPARVEARHTIVCCGTINTPALLMRSGLGPADVLAAAGVPVLRHVGGVGRNLQEHPAIGISSFVRRGNRHLRQDRHHTQMHMRFSSGLEGCPEGDMNMAVLARSAWHAVGGQLGTYYLWINKACSTGRVEIVSADPSKPPDIDFRLLSDPRDIRRMRDGFRRIAALALDPGLDGVRAEVFPTIFSDTVRKVSRPGRWNAFQTALFAGILDVFAFARPALIRALIAPDDIRAVIADDAVLDAYLHRAVVGVWHTVGTCRMGRAGDPAAVTDAAGRVHGVPGLRVADASLMPAVPCANTNIPILMVAERIADLVKAEAAAPPVQLRPQEIRP